MHPLLRRLFPFAQVPQAGAKGGNPDDFAAANRLIEDGNRAEDNGDPRAACGHYRKAVELAPGYARAHLNLGIGLAASGDADGAASSYQTAISIDPDYAPAHYNLAILLYARGALDEAATHLRLALAHKPEFPEAYVALSNVHDSQGDTAAAIAALESALAQRPEYVGALCNYAVVLRSAGRLHEAESALRKAVGIEPDNAQVRLDLAGLLRSRGALADAEQLLLSTLRLAPGDPDAHAALFHVYESQGDLAAAAAALEQALQQRPDWVGALNNYGNVLKKLRRMSEAEAAFRRALAADPSFAGTYRGLGGILIAQSRVAEAREVFRAGRAVDPHGFDLESAELYSLNLTDELSPQDIYARHRAFGERLEARYPKRTTPHPNARDPIRRLRIGYLSADFYQHPVALFALPLLERHDRSLYESYCYATGSVQDDITRKLQSLATGWRDAGPMSDVELVGQIAADGIDILVDLTSHSGDFRPGVLAQQPAPVQVTWLGYPFTTGTTRIQYRLTDRHTDPPGLADRCHTETLIRLPHSQWCYRPFVTVDCADSPPTKRNGFVTFGSFNEFSKLSPSIRKLWAAVLVQVPTARFAIARISEGPARDALLRDFESAGVAADRIRFLPPVPMDEYYRRFGTVDIALDSAPYSGCTTTCDTLWMGAPLVTFAGALSPARSSASLLNTVGLPEWIAHTPEEYVRLAIDLARDEATLSRPRRLLRQRMAASPVMDEAGFARDVEHACRQMWRAWCGRTEIG